MKAKSAQRKGKTGEVEAARILSEILGVPVRRESGPYLPGFSHPDVSRIGELHFEIKRRKFLDLTAWLRQAAQDAQGRVPVVVHRPNRAEWMLTIHLNDVIRFCREVAAAKRCLKGV